MSRGGDGDGDHCIVRFHVQRQEERVNSWSENTIFTVCNEVAARLYFHRHLSFCSQGGMYPSMHWADTPPPRAHTPLPGHTPSWVDTPPGRHPLHSACWDTRPPPRRGHCSGRYASYWDALLLAASFQILIFPSLVSKHLPS